MTTSRREGLAFRSQWLVALGPAVLVAIVAPLAGCLADAGASGDPQRSGFFVDPEKSLLIREGRIVEAAIRTFDPCTTQNPAGPSLDSEKWTFGYLMTQMANGHDPAIFAHNWLANWSLSSQVNGDPIPTLRASDGQSLAGRLYDAWQRKSGGVNGGPVALKMNRAPFRLLAIVNRFDLRNDPLQGTGTAGQLRFVFSALDLDNVEETGFGCQQQKSPDVDLGERGTELVILEYAVETADEQAKRNWALAWANLTNLDFGEPAFAPTLEQLTEQVVRAGVSKTRPNGSALLQIRTNETINDAEWDMREFTIDGPTGYLTPATVKQTPKGTLTDAQTMTLGTWINSPPNNSNIVAGTYVLPPQYVGAHAVNEASHTGWHFTNVTDSNLRHAFSKGTCNGCHSRETGTRFFHVHGRRAGEVSEISSFLNGDGYGNPACISDLFDGTPRCFYELGKRVDDLLAYLNGAP